MHASRTSLWLLAGIAFYFSVAIYAALRVVERFVGSATHATAWRCGLVRPLLGRASSSLSAMIGRCSMVRKGSCSPLGSSLSPPTRRRTRALDARALLLVGFPVVVAVLAFWAASARAAEPSYVPPEPGVSEPALSEALPSCPTAPAVYEGEDATVAELRSLRREAVQSCEAQVARQEQFLHRLWWVVAEAVSAHAQRVVTNEKLTAVVEALKPLGASLPVEVQGVSSSSPLPVHETEQSAVTVPLIQSATNSDELLGIGLWTIAGLMVGLFIGYVIYRQVMPRA